ncbi:transposase [Shinella sp.]|uniref:transposase n=1 Tax=Shinella sp. TaxID=1870904 RepID=UPI00403611F5
MAKHRIHSMEFKRQVAQEFIAGETLNGLAQRHDVSRNLIRSWVCKDEEGGSTMMLRPPTSSRNTRPGSLPSNAPSANRRWNWSF